MKFYRRIALSFVIITALILVAVVYASLIRAEIRLTPVEQQISSSFIVDISVRPVEEGEVRGRVVHRGVDLSDTFSLSADAEDATPVEGKASGIVTIINNRSLAQPLVATTRFLSEEGVLFRLDEGTSVPAGGSVEARITADEPGEAGDIGPGRFIIPGLSENLQDVVYGETAEAMRGGLRYVNVLTAEDIEAAVAELRDDAVETAKEVLREDVGVFAGEVFTTEEVSREVDTEVGAETDQFAVSAGFRVVGIFFDEEELYHQAESALYQDIERGLRPVGVNAEALSFTVDRFDLEEERATLRVELTGAAIPSAAHRALSRGVFAGMTPQEVVAYFEEQGLAKTVEVNLRPSWRKRVPKSPNKIKLLINE